MTSATNSLFFTAVQGLFVTKETRRVAMGTEKSEMSVMEEELLVRVCHVTVT